LAVAALVLWSVGPLLTGAARQDHLLQELVGSHVRSLMVDHLTDVLSDDSHMVKPWFEGKLDFSPQVPELAAQGFPLVGGRLDYLANRSVAAVVYRRRQHLINLFIWPTGSDVDVEETVVARQGYHLVPWQRSGMTYWAVSNLNQRELHEFIRAVQSYLATVTSP
jgi:anti-sigma factor RsiW